MLYSLHFIFYHFTATNPVNLVYFALRRIHQKLAYFTLFHYHSLPCFYQCFTSGWRMASVTRRGKKWRAHVCVRGIVATSTHNSKREAEQWAADKERELLSLAGGVSITHTVRDMFDRYAREVSPGKRGRRWELVRLDFLGRDQLADLKLSEVGPHHIAQWRDRRLKDVSGSTVNRDLNLISHCFAIARDEWRWIKESPTTGVRRPKESPPRDRLITDDEIDRFLIACGYADGRAVESVAQRVAVAFLFAIETAMRAGEICSLSPGDVTGRVARLPMTKNGFARDVPLSTRALQLLEAVGGSFGLSAQQLDVNFRKARDRAGIEGVTFHDSRHLAVTRLSKRLDVLALARMTGHRDLKQLQRYYNESAAELAGRLD